MDFIYRMPLVDFDPEDETELTNHWKEILAALACSSESLHRQIGNSPYSSLPRSMQDKIYKYLLRGRYRATPFGRWAGVGTGSWGKETSDKLSLAYREIASAAPDQSSGKETGGYHLAPSTKTYQHHVTYWNYSPKEEGWRIGHLERNSIIDQLLKYLNTWKSIDIDTFRTFFRDQGSGHVGRIWQLILDSGLLIPVSFPWSASSDLPSSLHVDIKLDSPIIVDSSVSSKLDALPKEMGAMFTPIQSPYLEDFKRWFLKNYDDRFVPLTLLCQETDFRLQLDPGQLLVHGAGQNLSDGQFWSEAVELDLRTLFEHHPVAASHLQFVFKLGQAGKIYLENIVGNRPFAYSGRFSLDPDIYEVITQTIPDGGKSSTAVYADLFLFDSVKSNYITRHKNAYQFTIYPFGPSCAPGMIGVDELDLGIREDHLILYCARLKKAIVPMVQHPLNPDQISHPLSRLLWEIGNQDQIKFLPYVHPAFQDSDYLPRLHWGDILIQGRRWRIRANRLTSKQKLADFLRKKKIPSAVLAGHLDRELLLDWYKERDLDLLWKELRLHPDLWVYECPWREDSAFSSLNGAALYPQFVHAWKGSEKTHAVPEFPNRVTRQDKRWVYVRIFVKPEGFTPFFLKSFPILVSSALEEFGLKKWYYLNYHSPEFEIRLRFEIGEKSYRQALESKIRVFVTRSGWAQEMLFAPYYPETEKYGEGGMADSETIFFWESELLVFGKKRGLSALFLKEEVQRLDLIVFLLEGVLLRTADPTGIFEQLKTWVKHIAPEHKAGLADIHSRPRSAAEITLQEEYTKLYLEHEYFAGQRQFSLLANHIHLFCNRAFPVDTRAYESKVICLLYRRMGKRLFGTRRASDPTDFKQIFAK